MEAKQFTLDELEKMLSDHFAFHLGNLDVASAQNGQALLQNTANIAKQLLSILNNDSRAEATPDHVIAEELETMLADHETYWSDRFGRGDIDAEKADVLPGRIVSITSQLIETMKSQQGLEKDHNLVIERACNVFQDIEKAMSWLNSPCTALGGQTPALLLNDAKGVELVMNTLGRMEHGVFS